jgi:hypothetical protein
MLSNRSSGAWLTSSKNRSKALFVNATIASEPGGERRFGLIEGELWPQKWPENVPHLVSKEGTRRPHSSA